MPATTNLMMFGVQKLYGAVEFVSGDWKLSRLRVGLRLHLCDWGTNIDVAWTVHARCVRTILTTFYHNYYEPLPYSRKIWRGIKFGGLYYNRQIKICQNFLLAYIHVRMAIPYRTAKFKSASILPIAILGSTVKFNSHQYFRLYGMQLLGMWPSFSYYNTVQSENLKALKIHVGWNVKAGKNLREKDPVPYPTRPHVLQIKKTRSSEW